LNTQYDCGGCPHPGARPEDGAAVAIADAINARLEPIAVATTNRATRDLEQLRCMVVSVCSSADPTSDRATVEPYTDLITRTPAEPAGGELRSPLFLEPLTCANVRE
jgi:hypothetical protein